MFQLFKSLFKPTDSNQVTEAIRSGALMVDVRSAGEFSGGSVAGAINIPLNLIANQASKLNNNKTIIVFCRSGNRSSQAKSILERMGFQNVINGGTWQNVQSALVSVA